MNLMDTFAPLRLAEAWDNPGLLVGSPEQEIHRALVTLDVTDEGVEFAIANKYDLIISHHPVILRNSRPCVLIRMTERCIRNSLPIILPSIVPIRTGIVPMAASMTYWHRGWG